MAELTTESEPGVGLYWLPLGAGGQSVRFNGRVFEAVAARRDRRRPCDLYHSALVARVPEGSFVIEMAEEAVESPHRLTRDAGLTRRLLDLAAQVPTPVWGRDELGAGEGWNSNSVTAWLIVRCGLFAESIHAPKGGRAPGWRAGLVVATRGRLSPAPMRASGGSSAGDS